MDQASVAQRRCDRLTSARVPHLSGLIFTGSHHKAAIGTERRVTHLCTMYQRWNGQFASISVPDAGRMVVARRNDSATVWTE